MNLDRRCIVEDGKGAIWEVTSRHQRLLCRSRLPNGVEKGGLKGLLRSQFHNITSYHRASFFRDGARRGRKFRRIFVRAPVSGGAARRR